MKAPIYKKNLENENEIYNIEIYKFLINSVLVLSDYIAQKVIHLSYVMPRANQFRFHLRTKNTSYKVSIHKTVIIFLFN